MKRFLSVLLLASMMGAGCATMEGMSAKTRAVPGDVVIEEVTTTFGDGRPSTTTVKRTYKSQAAADLELKKDEIKNRAKVRVAEANHRPVVVVEEGYGGGCGRRRNCGGRVISVGTRVPVGGGHHHHRSFPRGHR